MTLGRGRPRDDGGGGGRSLLLVASLALLVLVDATGLPVARAQPAEPAGIYRRPLGNDPATLDPARIADIYGRAIAQQVFDGLVRFDQTLTIAPALAEFWRASRDGLTWTFTLRKGVKFHHGREVTADDVVFSLTRILDPRLKSGAADLFASVKGAPEFRDGRAKTVAGIVALDRHTVQITLTEPFVGFASVLAVGHAKILPRDLVERDADHFGQAPSGTGPFRFERWERGKELVLTANRDYFGGAPRLARIVYRVFPGEQSDAMYDEFRRGQLEDSPVPVRNYRRIIADGGHVHVKRPMISVRFYGFNTRVKPLNDRRVRQALNHALDREGLIEELSFGRFALARGILPPGTLGFNPKLAGYAHDPQRARQLLQEAGYPGGRGLPPIQIWAGAKNDPVLREHELVRRALEAVGMRAEFRYLTDWPQYVKKLTAGECPVFLYALFADVPDPDTFLGKLHSQNPQNFFGYANRTVDDLLNEARREPDASRRVELYRRAEQLVVDDAPLLPIFHYTYDRLFQPYVKSVEVSGLGDPYIPFRKIWLERR
jgi:peptide/nickel transport system substrate-binding protein/oligopeptide transport system substrate-binding protein